MCMKDHQLFTEKASSGYVVCFKDACPRHAECLRWLTGQHMPEELNVCTCVNPSGKSVGTEQCTHFRKAEKVTMARGMTRIFSDDMPKRVENGVRQALIERHNRTYYFEYRNGTRLISPAMQEEVRQLFRDFGWTRDVEFDEYVEDYVW